MKLKTAVLSFLILIALAASALAWTPSSNINGRDYYNITGFPWINGTSLNGTYYGDGSNLNSSHSVTCNSSEYWDGLDDPSDISAGDITDDDTYALTAGDTFDGDVFIGGDFLHLGLLEEDCYIYFYDGADPEGETFIYLTEEEYFELSESLDVLGWINATDFYQDGNVVCDDSDNCAYISDASESDLNVNSSNYWDRLDDPLDLNYSHVLSQANITDEDWIEDSQEGNLNVNSSDYWYNYGSALDLNYTHVLSQANITDEDWIEDSQEGDLNVNSSDYSESWDGETSQGDLNVNSSDHWDNLGDPSDISTGDLTDDNTFIAVGDSFGGDVSGTYGSISLDCSDVIVNDHLNCDGENIDVDDDYVLNTGDTMTGNLTISTSGAGIHLGDSERIWFGDSDDASIYFNGTYLIIEG